MNYSSTKKEYKTSLSSSSYDSDITAIEPFDENRLFLCNETTLLCYDLKTNKEQTLNLGTASHSATAVTELNCLKYSNELNILFASNVCNTL